MHREKWNLKNEKTLNKLWDIFKKPNIYEIGVPEKKVGQRKRWMKKKLEEIMTENFPYLVKPIYPQI